MNSPEIEAIFHDALGLLPADRGVFVAASAKGNASVIAEVQRLRRSSAIRVTSSTWARFTHGLETTRTTCASANP
jgi:hypothetical protein